MAGGDEECLRELSRLREGGSGRKKSGSKLPHSHNGGGYWYRLAMMGLVLDRSSGSATLNALTPVERATVEPS
jgi:hypothetical protein